MANTGTVTQPQLSPRDYKLRIRDVNSDSAAWAMANDSADVIASLKLRIAC